ncbi:arylsulfotransferase family protein [Haloferax sp. DFSO52]|uniref:arylsulfotransferase family protein n=1 Tax=Haloferax sp. DFSO52 TaxID=3388505 RepID=UPI003A8528D2
MVPASRGKTGALFVLIGVGVVVATFVVGVTFASDIGVGAATSPDDGQANLTLVGSQGGGAGLHKYGSVYLLSDDNVSWRLADADSYFDVTALDDGRVIAAFMDSGYTDCGPYTSPCARTGYRIIDPNAEDGPVTVEEWSFPIRTMVNSEIHDVEPTESGEILVADMEYERILAVKDGEVTWQWEASSYYDAPADPTKEDWLHINDVDVIGEDRYLVSVRNANQVLVIERGSGVVDVINEDTDGDGMGEPTLLRHQHNPQWLGEGAILVADSENHRIVELHENESGVWEVAWTVESAEGVDLFWPRDADRLPNGNTLITDSGNQRILEVNRTGSVVWSTKTDYIPYEADRLPVGELVGAPRSDATLTGTPEISDVPVISPLLVAVRASYPLPYWFTEGYFVSIAFGLGAILTGFGLATLDIVNRLHRRRL